MLPSVSQRHNPYIIGPPVRNQAMFFGREELFQFIADNLHKDANVILLHGQRRIGKSSVLRQIPVFVGLKEGFFFFRFDLQDQARLPLAQVLRNLAVELRDHPDGTLAVTPPALEQLQQDPTLFATEFLPQVYRAIGHRKLALLLDEFDVLSNYTDEAAATHFFPFLQSIVYRHDRLVIIPVVGRRLDEIPTLLGLFREAPSQEIGLLDERSARRLITQPVSAWLSYSEEAIQAILELTAGHPYFTQLVCYVLCAQASADERNKIEPADVAACVDQVLVSGEGGLAWFRDGLPITERVCFSAVAEAEISAPVGLPPHYSSPAQMMLTKHGVVKTEELSRAQERLEKWGYISRYVTQTKRHAEGGTIVSSVYHRVTIKLVREWLRKRYPLAQEILELEQTDPKAQQLYQKAQQARQVPDRPFAVGLFEAFNLYHEALSANPNHFRALFDLAEVTLALHHFQESVELFQRAYKADPARTRQGYVQALLENASVKMQRAQYQQARDDYAQVLQLLPDHEAAQAGLKTAEAALRRALASHNPFTLTPIAPGEFVGRQEEVAAIFSKIRSRGHVSITGPGGIGKTSLLRHVAAPETWRKHSLKPDAAIVVFLNCRSITPFTNEAFWRELILSIQDCVEGDERLRKPVQDILQEFFAKRLDLLRTLRRISQQAEYLVIMLDEFDALFAASDTAPQSEVGKFIEQWRRLIASSSSDVLSTIIASRRPLDELSLADSSGSPWYNVYLPLPLKPLAEREFAALVAKMPTEFALNQAELDWARQAGEGRPYLLQAAFDLLYRHHASEEPFDLTRVQQEFAPLKAAFLKTSATTRQP